MTPPPPPATAVADMIQARQVPQAPPDSKINRDILAPTRYLSWQWGVMLLLAVLGVLQAVVALLYQTWHGLGVAGYQAPIFWGVYIITFVFWIGIGHAGTLISAILFLFRAKWRNAINRGAEAMTVFAVLRQPSSL
jgi:Ni/Fe-hydrogenase subunit HybB-like protein